MSRPSINIVWLKRDLRSQDHQAFHAAESAGLPYLIVYFFEPDLYNYPDTSTRHLQFVYKSLLQLNTVFEPYNRSVDWFECEAIEAFQFLSDQFHIVHIFSHQETGIAKTWERDKAVSRFADSHQIKWIEFQTNCVIRGLKNRIGWDQKWLNTMNTPMVENNYSKQEKLTFKNPYPLSKKMALQLKRYPTEFQPAGELFAWKYLASFAHKRGRNYARHISKPAESRQSCGRISPYLAWGNLSLKQAYHFVNNHPNYEFNKRAFNAFLMRLQWHCHFIQKFETECSYESHCVNRGYESLTYSGTDDMLEAWKTGNTGYPLIDACMRCVCETGWINFRMRAMLVSFLCHYLDLDWKSGVYHLAQQFLDYEPGIHYPQFQMQAGTTGTNLIRIYNPTKQAKDHDPQGGFIKKWVPELREVPVNFIHEPWKMTAMDQTFCDVYLGKDYPFPIIELTETARRAREKYWGQRSNNYVKSERQRILKTHVRPSK